MGSASHLTYHSALILQAVARGYSYGFDIMSVTGLPSGTVYPVLRRLADGRLVRSRWESDVAARREQRPARRYYEVTRAGERALDDAVRHHRMLERILPLIAPKPRPSESG
jgi:DNA-binding PadR family transcriptional regulator